MNAATATHSVALTAGALVVLWEAFETIVLPRRVTRRFRLTRAFYRGTWLPWRAIGQALPRGADARGFSRRRAGAHRRAGGARAPRLPGGARSRAGARDVASDRFAAEVREEEEAARQIGITGVPFFVMGGVVGVSGAQAADVLLGALEQAWERVGAAGEAASAAEGAACGPDGCG